MDKIKFIAFFLLVAFGVQHIQIQQERENWKKLCIQLDAERAEAAIPLVVAAVPVVLSAIVAGSAIGWTQYNANGKAAWVKFTGAVKDGAQVTKRWIEEQILGNNGVNIEGPTYYENGIPTLPVDLQGQVQPDTYFSASAPYQPGPYRITGIISDWSYGGKYNQIPSGEPVSAVYYGHSGYVINGMTYKVWRPDGIYFRAWSKSYRVEQVSEVPSGYDPADYPQYLSGPSLLSNCHQVAQDNPDIKATYEFSHIQPPDAINEPVQEIGGYTNGYIVDPQGNVIDVNTVLQSANTITGPDGTVYDMSNYTPAGQYIEDSQGNKIYLSDILTDDGGTITMPDGTVHTVPKYGTPTYVDSTGNIIPSLPSDVANHLGLDISELSHNAYSDKYIATGVATPDTSDDGRKFLPGWLDTRLKGSGIDLGAGSTIKGVSKDGRIDWVDSSGTARITLVDSAMAESLIQNGVAVRTVKNGVTTYTQAATSTPADPMDFDDPGSPIPPPVGSGEFDTSFDWGTEDEFDIDYWKGVLGSLPLMNLLNGSSLNLSTANPVLSIPLSSWPGGPITLSVDFSDYEVLFNLMGGIIYFFALIYSISLALTGRGL